jgi:hypothetical protein
MTVKGTITETPVLAVSSQGNPVGVVIDGVVYQLEGEPPPASPGGWLRKTT